MDSIYKYTNYREFLKDFLKNKKKNNKNYSLRVLSEKSGFKARDFVLRLINGTRNLSKSGMFKLSEGLGLSVKEAAYFEDLVSFNQAKSANEKKHYFERMSINIKGEEPQKLREEQFSYLSRSYHVAIRSLLPVINFKDDFAALGKFLDPPITVVQAKQSVNLLLKLGLLEKTSNGVYRVSSPSITVDEKVKDVALSVYHKTIGELGLRSLEEHLSTVRDISGVTMSLSANGFSRLRSEIKAFRKKAIAIANTDSREDRVCQLEIQLFPLSKIRGKR
jgi:uncharacterized protein (TIGR02147 family)